MQSSQRNERSTRRAAEDELQTEIDALREKVRTKAGSSHRCPTDRATPHPWSDLTIDPLPSSLSIVDGYKLPVASRTTGFTA